MRNRSFEAILVLGIGVMTTVTVGSYIHDVNTGKEQQFDHRIGQFIQSITHFASSATPPIRDGGSP